MGSRDEIRDALRDMGQNPDENKINLLLAKIDKNGNGIIDNEELIAFMREHLGLDDPVGDLGPVFRMLDTTNTGTVLGKDIREMVWRYANPRDDPENPIEEVINAFNETQRYTFDQFISVITQGEEPTTRDNLGNHRTITKEPRRTKARTKAKNYK